MNRFERELKARHGIINNRRWEGNRRAPMFGYEISEIHPDGAGCAHVMPGNWHGKQNLGFAVLDHAAFWRKAAMIAGRPNAKRVQINYAREAVERSRFLRLHAQGRPEQVMARAA